MGSWKTGIFRGDRALAPTLRIGTVLFLIVGAERVAGAAGSGDEFAPQAEVGVSVSMLWPASDSGTLEQHGYGWGLALGGGYRFHPHWACELNFVALNREYDTPDPIHYNWGPVDSTMDLETRGVEVGLRALLPLEWLEFFAGAGIGYYKSELTVNAYPFYTLGLLSEELVKEKDAGVGYRLSAGVDFKLGRVRLGVEYRYLFLRGDFGELSGGEADIGGSQVALRMRYLWDIGWN